MIDQAEARTTLATLAPSSELFSFYEALESAGAFSTDPRHTARFFEKPWHWDGEYAVWVAHDRPMDDSMGGWEDFCAVIA